MYDFFVQQLHFAKALVTDSFLFTILIMIVLRNSISLSDLIVIMSVCFSKLSLFNSVDNFSSVSFFLHKKRNPSDSRIIINNNKGVFYTFIAD